MPRTDFPEYKPDLNDNLNPVSNNVLNVVPRADGYGPFKDFVSLSASLPAPCRGYFFSRNTDGSVSIFAGTVNKLYELNNTTFVWNDVSLGGSTYTSLNANAQWDFTQFESLVIAVQANAIPQVFTIGSSTAFANLTNTGTGGGFAPNAAYVTTISGFIVLSGLPTNPLRAQWSDLFNPTIWTPGQAQADFQDFPAGGLVRSIAGFDLFGILMQDAAIRLMTYAPGNPVIFQITKITDNDGIFAPFMMATAQQSVFFLSPQGFKRIDPGGFPVPIGKERVDRFFFNNADTTNPQLMLAASDPKNNRMIFAFKSTAGQAGLFDLFLLYDWVLDRWAKIKMTGEFLADLSAPGATLEGLDVAAPGQINISASSAGATYANKNFVGSCAGGVLTVIAQQSAVIATGQTLTGAGVTGGTTITGPGTAPSTWNLNNSFTVGREILTVTQPSVRLTVSGLGTSGGENFFLGSAGTPNMNSVEVYYATIPTGGLLTNEAIGNWPYQVIDATHIDVIGPTFSANIIHNSAVAQVGGSIDLLTQSLDSLSAAALPTIAMCNSNGMIGFFTGPNLEAQVETNEGGSPDGDRMFIQGFRVISDAPTIMGSSSFRDNPQQQTYNYTAEAVNDNLGICRHGRIDTRYSRSKVRIPYGTVWTYVRSIEQVDLDETGTR